MEEILLHFYDADFVPWIALLLGALILLTYLQGLDRYNSILGGSPLPGPKPWPWVGNLPDVFKYGGMHKMFLSYFHKYGRVHTMCFGRTPIIVVSDPQIVKQILVKDFSKFPNRPPFVKPRPPFDSGLFVARGDTWKRIRGTLTPSFTGSKLKQIVPIMEQASEKLLEKVQTFSETGESVDANNLFSLFALDVIMMAAFGFETDLQTNPDPTFVDKARNVFKTPLWIRAFSMFPFWTYFSRYVTVLQDADYFLAMARAMLQERQQSSLNKQDLLQLMLDAHKVNVDGVRKLSDGEVTAQSVTFLVAGFETTGNTLCSTAFFLATNPDVQDRLIREIDQATATRGDAPLYEFAQSIAYLDQLLSEVLRLCPPGFNLIRGCEDDVEYNDVRFPKGVDVVIPTYVLHRDPNVWANPLEFNPDNFSPEAKGTRDPYSFLPFGTGPRQCIGTRFALLEMKVALLAIMQRFKFERAPETVAQLEHTAVLLMAPKDVIYVKIRAR